MKVEGLEWQEVLDRYQKVKSQNEHWVERKEHYEEEIEDADETLEGIRTEYRNESKASQEHTERLKTIVSAFLPGNDIADRTQWRFKTIRPLKSMDGESPDVVLLKPETGGLFVATLLRKRERPITAVHRLEEATITVRNHPRLLQDEMDGKSFDERKVEPVLIIPESADKDTVEMIEEREQSGQHSEKPYIWKITKTKKEEIKAITQIEGRSEDECLPEGELGRLLEEGIEVAKTAHSLPDFFVDSHHQTYAEKTVGRMVQTRMKDGAQVTHFSSKDLKRYFRQTLSASRSEDLAGKKVSEMIRRWKAMGLIEPITESQSRLDDGSDYYRFDVDTNRGPNTMSKVKDEYPSYAIQFDVEIEAMRRVLEEYSEEQSSLEEFAT